MSRIVKGMIVKNRSQKTRKRTLRPRNETAYRNCKMALKKFGKATTKKNYSNLQAALTNLLLVNPTMAMAFQKQLKQLLFDRSLKEENLK